MSKNTKTVNEPLKISLNLFFYCIIGILVCIITALLSSLLIAHEKIEPTYIELASSISIYLGALISCFLTAKNFGKTILSSLIQGVVYAFTLFIIGAVMFSRLLPDFFSPSSFVSTVTAAITAAILSALFNRKRH